MAVGLPRPITRGVLASRGGGGYAPSIIEYKPPTYDEEQVKAYQQEALAPGISGLRRLMREAQAGRYASPSARSEALRGLTRGYGEALAPLQVGAGAQARQRYDIQYQQAILAEQQRIRAEERAAEREYQDSLRGGTRTRRASTRGLAPSQLTPIPEAPRQNLGWFSTPIGEGRSIQTRGAGRTGAIAGGPTPVQEQPQPVAEAYPANWYA
jgi:hypothetical protein